MQLERSGTKINLNDDSLEALRIREGYDWELDERGRVVILNTKSAPDFEVILPKLKSGVANMREIQEALAHLVEKALK